MKKVTSPARRAACAGVVLAFVAIVVGCKKGEGSACKGKASLCLDNTAALTCVGEKFVRAPCAGPLGCTKFQDHANCDASVAEEGDFCLASDDDYACSPDKKRALACTKGVMAKVMDCRGKGGCAVLGRSLSCDQTVANVGEVCKSPGARACGPDGKQMVTCQDGKFVLYRQCRGKGGCAFADELVTCDQTQAQEGDACSVQGQVVCALDGQTELVCQGSTFLRSRTCKKGCAVKSGGGKRIECD